MYAQKMILLQRRWWRSSPRDTATRFSSRRGDPPPEVQSPRPTKGMLCEHPEGCDVIWGGREGLVASLLFSVQEPNAVVVADPEKKSTVTLQLPTV